MVTMTRDSSVGIPAARTPHGWHNCARDIWKPITNAAWILFFRGCVYSYTIYNFLELLFITKVINLKGLPSVLVNKDITNLSI